MVGEFVADDVMIFFKLLRGLASCWLNITFVWPSLVRCQPNGLKMKQITERLVCMLILVQLTERVTGHVKKKKKKGWLSQNLMRAGLRN